MNNKLDLSTFQWVILWSGPVERLVCGGVPRGLPRLKLVQVLAQSHRRHNPPSIRALFSLPGFVAASRLHGVFGDRYARVLVLRRRTNQRSARNVDTGAAGAMIHAPAVPATSRLAGSGSMSSSSGFGSTARGAVACS